ncbi:tripartite tricarboxylate transporter substrate binding protein [Virgibacillus necropolis]|nr:tripartite tricarboxylate transporter substrate binding protein [Virgibacillus necropolis]
MKIRKVNLLILLLVSLVFALAGCNQSSEKASGNEGLGDYPSQPIEAIIAFNAGGGTDVAARTVLRYAEEYADTSFAVLNKPGAAGEIGFTTLANAEPDGYTIGMINPPTTLLHPIQRPDEVKYTLDDFKLIANVVSDPGALVVKADSSINSLKDLFDAVRKKPDLNLAYGGPGTSEALTLRRIEEMEDISFNKIPFEGTSPALSALLGGHVEVLITNASEVVSQLKDGKIKVLAVGAEERIDMMPDVPTYKEEGLDLIQVSMRGFAAPKGISDEQQKFLADVIKKTMEDEEFQKKAEEMALPLDYKGPEEYKEFLEDMNKDLQEEYEKNPW